MGTTSTALASQDGIRLGFSLVIEGWEYIVTDAGDSELGAVADAYEASEWGAQAGWGPDYIKDWFVIEGKIRRAIQPWQLELDVPTLTFRVFNETFARAVCKTKPSYRSQLASPFSPAADGSGVLTVKSNAAANASGSLYMGHKRVEYSAKSGGTGFTVSADGAQSYSPFAAVAGNKFALPHEMSAGKNWDAAAQPWVSDVPPSWLGRRVALYCHRIVGGVWDTVANAQLEFAGRIRDIVEDTRSGSIVLSCEDLLADVRDTVLLKGQWIGYVKPGLQLIEGDRFYAYEYEQGGTRQTSDPLVVVASGASGTDEINAGYIETETFIDKLVAWLTNDPNLDEKWRIQLSPTDGGLRTQIEVEFSSAPSAVSHHWFRLYCNNPQPLDWLGFREDIKHGDNGGYYIEYKDNVQTLLYTSLEAPLRIAPFQREANKHGNARTIDLQTSDGTFVNHTAYLPAPFDTYPESGENRSFVRIGDALFFAKYASATQLTEVTRGLNFASFASDLTGNLRSVCLTVDDAGDRLEIAQVVVLADSCASLIPKLFASTGTAGVNHATHDVFPTAMGCPGIPWSLLGDDFVNSLKLLEQANKDEAIMIVIDRPTRLVDVLLPELLLRFAWLTWKANGGDNGNGGYHFVSPPTPNALTADYTLDETNKVSAGQSDIGFASTRMTLEHCRNLIKVNYNRTPGGKYQDHLIVRDEASISDFKPLAVTIDAPNSYADSSGTGASVEALAASLVARTMPMFSKPIKTVRRTIPHTLYGMSCGSTAVLSDNDVRDPTTGERGISNRACIVLAVTHHPGYGAEGQDPYGEVELLLTDEDRTYPLAPAAEVDTSYSGTVDGITFTNGYAATAAGGPALKLKEHAYSRSTGLTDAEGFANSDLVRVYEIDPADPTSFDAWSRTLAASGAVDAVDDYIKLTSDISAPAWGGATKLYRVVPQLYTAVTATQKLKAFIADDADGLIQDAAQPNLYGEKPMAGAFTRVTGADVPTLIANEVDDEGRPVHPGLLNDLIRMANNLASYKAAPHCPETWDTNWPTSVLTAYRIVFVRPFPIGGYLYKATRRIIKVATRLSISDAAQTATARVTSSRHAPYHSDDGTPAWSGPKRQITFTRTGSTSSADQAIQDLPIVKGDIPGMTWITVELKTSNVAATANLRGLPTFYLGPVVPA